MAQITQLSAIAVPGRRYGLVVRGIQSLTLASSASFVLIGQAFSVDTLMIVMAPQSLTPVAIGSVVVIFDLSLDRQASFNLGLDRQMLFDLGLDRQASFDLNIDMMEVD